MNPLLALPLIAPSTSATSLVEPLGWTLVHFTWQAAAVAGCLGVALRVLRRASSNARYLAASAAMLAMAVLPMVTFPLLVRHARLAAVEPLLNAEALALTAPVSPRPVVPTVAEFGADTGNEAVRHASSLQPVAGGRVANLTTSASPAAKEAANATGLYGWRAALRRAADGLRGVLPWVVAAWCFGVLGLSAWHLGGWAYARRLVRAGTRAAPPAWQARLSGLAKRLRVTRPVQLLESARVRVPAVIGWLRPVVLVPAGALSGMPVAQIEAILAHELAHVRRHDYLVNLLQTAVETLLFYHPAVWWVSGRVRAEREDCCDDVAAAACGSPVLYARALAALEERRSAALDGSSRYPSGPALAATGTGGRMPLLRRIRRLVAPHAYGTALPCGDRGGALPAAAGALVAMATLAAAVTFSLAGAAVDEKKAVAGARGDRGDSPLRVTLAGGGTVDLVGVSYESPGGRRWSTPAGGPLAGAGFVVEGVRTFPQPGETARAFVVRVSGLRKGASSPAFALEPSTSTAVGGARTEGAPEADPELHALAASLPASAASATLKVGIASGEWETLAEARPAGGSAVAVRDQAVLFAAGHEFQGGAAVTIAHDVVDRDLRVVAVDADGKEHAARVTQSSKVARLTQGTFVFPQLKLDTVKAFRFQSRPYEWAEFQVALPPGGKAAGVAPPAGAAVELPAAAGAGNPAGDDVKPGGVPVLSDIPHVGPLFVNENAAGANDEAGEEDWLSHVDNTAEGKKSIAGSGHAVMFERAGNAAAKVTAVKIFASRYGHPKPPAENFHVHLLDAEQKVLADVPVPYKTIQRGDMRWYELRVPATSVPRKFMVAVSFDPAQTKGVYLGMDKDVAKSHSYTGLPERGFTAVEDTFDWMVGVKLDAGDPAPEPAPGGGAKDKR